MKGTGEEDMPSCMSRILGFNVVILTVRVQVEN